MALSDNFKGALLVSLAMASFSTNDTLVKSVTAELTTGQVIFIRGAVSSLLVFLVARHLGALRPVKTIWTPMLALRVAGELAAAASYIYALSKMPLANAGAILQFLPLAVTLGAALFLREPVGLRRWGAIIAGFIGVLLILKPGPEGFSLASVFALLCVFAAASRDLATRRLPAGIPSLFVTLVTAIAVTISGALLIEPLGGWQPVSLRAFVSLAVAACFLLIGYQALITAMRIGEISFVSPFRYTYLIWALALSYTVFGDIPDIYMLAGSAIVVASGIYTFYRENVKKRRPLAQTAIPRIPT